MDINEYESLTGITVATSQEALITATITKTQTLLESILGYTLDETKVNVNQYTELGKTPSECPSTCNINIDSLTPPDAVIYAYRIFDYNKKDKFIAIDPCTEIHKVKLIVGNVTVKTLVEYEDYRIDQKNGLIKYLEKVDCCWCSNLDCCENVQLAVDAEWVWQDEDDIPLDLKYIWTDMITSYSDCSDNIKSETLGPHSYTKFDNVKPEQKAENLLIIKKYSGPNGIINKIITI